MTPAVSARKLTGPLLVATLLTLFLLVRRATGENPDGWRLALLAAAFVGLLSLPVSG